MEYRFALLTVPEETAGYHLPAYTEGPLDVWLAGHRFVRVDEALLVEFAIVLSRWLRDQPCDLYYASMDFEDEPVFALTREGERFRPSSVWASGLPTSVRIDDALAAARHYIDALALQLQERGADLGAVVDEAMAADCG